MLFSKPDCQKLLKLKIFSYEIRSTAVADEGRDLGQVKVHKGFWDAYESVSSELLALLRDVIDQVCSRG